MTDSLREQYASTLLYGGNASFVEGLYESFVRDPGSVSPEWREYFARLGAGGETPHGPILAELRERARRPRAVASDSHEASAKQAAVSRLIQIYANRGHLIAKLDPLGLMQRPVPRVLELEYFGLTEADLDTEFFTGSRTAAIARS